MAFENEKQIEEIFNLSQGFGEITMGERIDTLKLGFSMNKSKNVVETFYNIEGENWYPEYIYEYDTIDDVYFWDSSSAEIMKNEYMGAIYDETEITELIAPALPSEVLEIETGQFTEVYCISSRRDTRVRRDTETTLRFNTASIGSDTLFFKTPATEVVNIEGEPGEVIRGYWTISDDPSTGNIIGDFIQGIGSLYLQNTYQGSLYFTQGQSYSPVGPTEWNYSTFPLEEDEISNVETPITVTRNLTLEGIRTIQVNHVENRTRSSWFIYKIDPESPQEDDSYDVPWTGDAGWTAYVDTEMLNELHTENSWSLTNPFSGDSWTPREDYVDIGVFNTGDETYTAPPFLYYRNGYDWGDAGHDEILYDGLDWSETGYADRSTKYEQYEYGYSTGVTDKTSWDNYVASDIIKNYTVTTTIYVTNPEVTHTEYEYQYYEWDEDGNITSDYTYYDSDGGMEDTSNGGDNPGWTLELTGNTYEVVDEYESCSTDVQDTYVSTENTATNQTESVYNGCSRIESVANYYTTEEKESMASDLYYNPGTGDYADGYNNGFGGLANENPVTKTTEFVQAHYVYESRDYEQYRNQTITTNGGELFSQDKSLSNVSETVIVTDRTFENSYDILCYKYRRYYDEYWVRDDASSTLAGKAYADLLLKSFHMVPVMKMDDPCPLDSFVFSWFKLVSYSNMSLFGFMLNIALQEYMSEEHSEEDNKKAAFAVAFLSFAFGGMNWSSGFNAAAAGVTSYQNMEISRYSHMEQRLDDERAQLEAEDEEDEEDEPAVFKFTSQRARKNYMPLDALSDRFDRKTDKTKQYDRIYRGKEYYGNN